MEPKRIVQRKLDGDVWETIEMNDLTEGDVFVMFEPDGTPVPDNHGRTVFTAAGDPELFRNDEDGDVYMIEIVGDNVAKDRSCV